jgi:hypothetical protein
MHVLKRAQQILLWLLVLLGGQRGNQGAALGSF